MYIRKTLWEDLPRLEDIYRRARAFMAENGNPTQWGGGYPWRDMLEEDLALGQSYVCVEDGGVVGTFCFFVGEEPTYAVIREGAWLREGPYGVIHRVASSGERKGVAAACIRWCFEQWPNLRIDTHADNLPMQRAVLREGFVYCGRVTVEDGTERLAYQKVE